MTLDVKPAEGREFNPRLEHYCALVTQWLECRSYERPLLFSPKLPVMFSKLAAGSSKRRAKLCWFRHQASHFALLIVESGTALFVLWGTRVQASIVRGQIDKKCKRTLQLLTSAKA